MADEQTDLQKIDGIELPAPESEAQKKARLARCEQQQKDIGYVSFKNRYSEREIYDAMAESKGVAKYVQQKLSCRLGEFYRWLSCSAQRFEFWKNCRKELVVDAEAVLLRHLSSQNEQVAQNAAKFILERLARDEWSPGPQIAQQIVTQGDVDIRTIFGISS